MKEDRLVQMTTKSTGLDSVAFLDKQCQNVRLVVAGEKGMDTASVLTWIDSFEVKKGQDSPSIVNVGTCARLQSSNEADIFILKER